MRMKGFFLTIDSLLALAVLFLAIGVLALGAQQAQPNTDYGAIEALARDYLVVNYINNVSLSPATFNTLTAFTISESAPVTGAVVIGSQAVAYPFPLAACGCAGVQCYLTASVNATCLGSQQSLAGALKRAWVTP